MNHFLILIQALRADPWRAFPFPVAGLQAGAAYAAGIAVLCGLVPPAAKRMWTRSRQPPCLPERPASLAALSAAR